MEIRSPQNKIEFDAYYELRWKVLRKPWGKVQGSEQDEFEDGSKHIAAFENKKVIGVARLQETAPKQLQLRYMAVAKHAQNKGVGKAIIAYAEHYAKQHKYSEIFLHARENALGFYLHLHYKKVAKSYVLFGNIQHYKMQKLLEHL